MVKETKITSKQRLKKAINENNRWYKNCKNVRKRGGKICQVCPFRKQIERIENNK